MQYRAVLDKYCTACHSQKLATAGIVLEKVDLTKVPSDAQLWEKVIRRLRGGSMPPQGMPHPTPELVDQFAGWLEGTLDRAYAAKPVVGRNLIHRLNRAEYANAIRDLLDLRVDVTPLLPADNSSYGFDNNADVLKTSPLLIERYLSAAMKISSLAIGDRDTEPVSDKFPIRLDVPQTEHIEGLPSGTRGGTVVHYNFPLDAEYVLQARLVEPTNNSDRGLEGEDVPQQFEISIDGVQVFKTMVGGKEDDRLSFESAAKAREMVRERMKTRVFVKAGPHTVGFTFFDRMTGFSLDLLQTLLRPNLDNNEGGTPAQLASVAITGPFNPGGPGETPSRKRVLTCKPKSAGDEYRCAREILTTLARRAYRRPVNDGDLETLLGFYQQGRTGASFERGIQTALARLLASPTFLFRAETDSSGRGVHPISDLELASRLSFFLWSSIPDDELLSLASKGKLRDRAVLEQQVRRMLADPRSHALSSNFAGQWLALRNLETIIPDPLAFPDFDDNLRHAFVRETEMFFDSILREDRNVLDLLDADYTFLNGRLAKHYGIAGVSGDEFRRVKLLDDRRRGLFGQGSILTLTSHPNRTSPVVRGKWILSNILNTPPQSPPPNVPTLPENTANLKPRSVRERLEEHRSNPVCMSCHKNLDPVGFSLENFDAVGAWRSVGEGGAPIDASGVLADGSSVDGPVALRKAILSRPNVFVGTLVEKLLTYGLGRGADYYDMPAVRSIVRDSSKNGYRFSSIILGIVESVPFRMRADSDDSETAEAFEYRRR